MRGLQPTFPDVTLDQYFPYQDKLPRCSNLRTNVTILAFRHRDETRDEWRYVDAGCGKVYLCHSCALNYNERKYRYAWSLTKNLFEVFPKLNLAHVVLTVPHDHPWTHEEDSVVYSRMFQSAKKVIFELFPDCGALFALHNWSSERPTEQHLHIHCLVFALNSHGVTRSAYIDVHALNNLWRDAIDYDSPVVVHSEYFTRQHFAKIKHVIRYNLRSPIQDWCNDIERPLTAAYLHRVKYLYRVHRIRWFGWMGPRVLHQQLEHFGVFLIRDDSEKTWIFSHTEFSQGPWFDGHLLMIGDTDLRKVEVTDISEILPTKFFQYQKPP